MLKRVPLEKDESLDRFGYKNTFDIRLGHKPSWILAEALKEEGIEFRFNVRADAREIRQDGKDWILAPNRVMDRVRVTLMENYGYIKTKNGIPKPLKWDHYDWKMLLGNMDARSECDPFVDWLKTLPIWDGTERIDNMLATLFSEHPQAPRNSLKTEFGKWASRFPFIAAVQKAFYADSWEPDDQISTRPLFVGSKGIGKSKMIANFLPQERRWINENFIITSSVKKMVEGSSGMVFCECADMAGLTRKNLTTWMAFVTSQRTRERLTWRPDPENYLQRAIFIGTTNDLRCIPSSKDGWRRDLPTLLGRAYRAVEPWIVKNREQLWAEAIAKVEDHGVRALIPYEMREKAAAHTERFRRRNDPIEDCVGRLPQEFRAQTTTDLMVLSGLVYSPTDAVGLHVDTQHHFIDRLYAYGCVQKDFIDAKGRKQKGWWREKEQKNTE